MNTPGAPAGQGGGQAAQGAGPDRVPGSSLALLFAEAVRHHQAGRLGDAARLYRQVCAADPSHVDAVHYLGVVAHQLGRNDVAIGLIGRALALRPDDADAHYNLANAYRAQGQLDEALTHYRRTLALKPDQADVHNNLGNVLKDQCKLAEAKACYQRALAIKPDLIEALNNLGNVLHAEGKLTEAVARYRQVLALHPGYAEVHQHLGNVLEDQGELAKAAACFERALALNPNLVEARNNLGNLLRDEGRPDEAAEHYRRALALEPHRAEIHHNLGNALSAQRKHAEAMACYRRALELQPNLAGVHYSLGRALYDEGKRSEAIAHYDRALASDPYHAQAKLARCMAELPILYMDEAEIPRQRAAYRDRLIALREDLARSGDLGDLAPAVGSSQPFLLAYQGRNDRDLQSLYGALVCRIMAERYPAPTLARPPAPGEPIKVGFVGAYFRRHSVWKIPLKGWLSQLDRGRFRVFGYHTDVEKDAETAAAAALCDRFAQGPLSLDAWRRTILSDAPHVLIYPEIGMERVAAQLAVQRLAPVQCNGLGHPVTSGFPTLDYCLSSDLMEPPDAQDHYTERLIRLPNLAVYYEPADKPAVSVSRSELGLRPGATVYWCSQSLFKYLPQFDEVFPRIAREAGDCQFTFIEHHRSPYLTQLFRERLERKFAAFGLRAAEHCVYLKRLDPQQFLAAMGQCDVFLNSISWSGNNSAMESLVQDLPIVTTTGPFMRSRHATAILEMMGVTETTAQSLDEYVAIAVRMARDVTWRLAVRRRISERKHRVYRDRTCISALEEFLSRVARPAAAGVGAA